MRSHQSPTGVPSPSPIDAVAPGSKLLAQRAGDGLEQLHGGDLHGLEGAVLDLSAPPRPVCALAQQNTPIAPRLATTCGSAFASESNDPGPATISGAARIAPATPRAASREGLRHVVAGESQVAERGVCERHGVRAHAAAVAGDHGHRSHTPRATAAVASACAGPSASR